MPTLKTDIRFLPIHLTASEQETAGKDLAAKCVEIDDAEDAEAERRKIVKERLTMLDGELKRLVVLVQTGIHTGEVSVRLELNGESVTETRLDTGEILMTRPATKEEMQQRLQLLGDETVTLSSRGRSVTLDGDTFSKAAESA